MEKKSYESSQPEKPRKGKKALLKTETDSRKTAMGKSIKAKSKAKVAAGSKSVDSVSAAKKAALLEELKALTALDDDEIKLDDIPERLDWTSAEIGKFYRPKKQLVSLRVDKDVVAWFKKLADERDEGYLTLMNMALREYVTRMERGR